MLKKVFGVYKMFILHTNESFCGIIGLCAGTFPIPIIDDGVRRLFVPRRPPRGGGGSGRRRHFRFGRGAGRVRLRRQRRGILLKGVGGNGTCRLTTRKVFVVGSNEVELKSNNGI
jgi:hypothetical protein